MKGFHLPYTPLSLPSAYLSHTIPSTIMRNLHPMPDKQAEPTNGPTSSLTIKSLASRDADKDIRAALNMKAIYITDLEDGRFVLSDRAQNFYLVVESSLDYEAFLIYKQMLETSRMSAEAAWYGEPSVRDLATDLRSARTFVPAKPRVPTLDIEIEL
jgi:hypothetical protein